MSAIQPPSRTLWWKQPLDRVEGTWIIIALIWSLIMFIMMPLWHVYSFQPEWRHAIPRDRLRYFTCSNPAARIMPAKGSCAGKRRIDSIR